MNPTIEILLKRMESNPDEFNYSLNLGRSKWDAIYEDFEHHLSEEDKTAYQEGKKKISLNRFHARVMEELLDPKSQTPSDIELKSAMRSGGQTHAQHMALHQQALQMQSMQMAYEAHQAQQRIKAQQAQNPYQQASLGGLSSLGNLLGGQSK